MRAVDVRIRKALEPGDSYVDAEFMLVETTLNEDGEPVTTIEHLASYTVDGRDRWHLTSVPLSHAAALEWAVSFAASRDIPVVYERDDSGEPRHAAAVSAVAASFSSASK